MKNFIIPRLDLSTLNVVPLMTLVIIYSSVIPRDGLGANGTSASIRNRTTVRGNIATNEGSSLLKTAIGICVVATLKCKKRFRVSLKENSGLVSTERNACSLLKLHQ